MKILLAPSETKTAHYDSEFNINTLLLKQSIDARQTCINKYNELITNRDISEIFGLKKSSDIEFYMNQINRNSDATKAIKLYTGVAFDYLDYGSLKFNAQNYIDENVIIFSNLFGAISAADILPKYRLKQGASLGGIKTDQIYKRTQSLLLDEMLKDEDILDIRAGYYDKFYTPTKSYTTLKFLKDGKVVSHFAKAYRGKILREVAKHEIKTIKDFMNMSIENLTITEIQKRKNRTEVIYNIGA